MNSLLEKGIISELKCGSDFAYILSDDDIFLPTEYKVLQNQWNSSFIKCMKLKFNGKMELLYLAGNLKPLSALIPNLSVENFILVVSKILEQIIAVKENGFISCKNIDISFDRVYVDPSTYKVSFIYLPVREHFYEDDAFFENELRASIVKTVFGNQSLSSPVTTQLVADLQNGSFTIRDLFVKYSSGNNIRVSAAPQQGNVMPNAQAAPSQAAPQTQASGPVLQAINGEPGFTITITKKDFVIGKKETEVDASVPYNKMISRKHCMVMIRNNELYVVDLHSSNGTFVNGARLEPNQPQVLKRGDVLRLANSDFTVNY